MSTASVADLRYANQKAVSKIQGVRSLYRVWNHESIVRYGRKQVKSFTASNPTLSYWIVSNESVMLLDNLDKDNNQKFKVCIKYFKSHTKGVKFFESSKILLNEIFGNEINFIRGWPYQGSGV